MYSTCRLALISFASVILAVLSIGCTGCTATKDSASSEHVASLSQHLDSPASEDFESYTDGADMNGQSGGSNWTSGWSVTNGSVHVSSEQAQSGSLSAKFGFMSDDIMTRTLSFADGNELDIYVHVPATSDAVGVIEIRDDESLMFTARFNYLTPGNVSVLDNQIGWHDVGAFVDNDWNKLGLVMNGSAGLMDVYLNDTLLVSSVNGGNGSLSRVILEMACQNGTNIYVDSITQVDGPAMNLPPPPPPPPPDGEAADDFESYSDGVSMAGLAGGPFWGSPWSVANGSVFVSSEQAQSGSLSAKFGFSSDDIMERTLDLDDGDELDLYVYVPATSDAVGVIEVRDGNSLAFTVRFNYLTPGYLAVMDNGGWTDVAPFNGGTWNKLGLVMSASTNLMDVYLNDMLVKSGAAGMGENSLSTLHLEMACQNGTNIYVDSINQIYAGDQSDSSRGSTPPSPPPPPVTEDFESYSNGASMDTQNGGTNWTSGWTVNNGSVIASSDLAQSGSLSAEFGFSSDDIMTRSLTMSNGDELDMYVHVPATSDAVGVIEIRSDESLVFTARFNYLTPGNVSVLDANVGWYDVGAFNDNAWNKLGLVMNAGTNLMDVYINDAQVATGVNGLGGGPLNLLHLEMACQNGTNIYVDSITQIQH